MNYPISNIRENMLINPGESFLKDAGDRPPLGLLYLSSALNANGISNSVHDMNHESLEDVVKAVERETPLRIGVSVYTTPNKPVAYNLMSTLKKKFPNKMYFVGGHHINAAPKDFAGLSEMAVQGHGEDLLVAISTFNATVNKFDINRYPIPNRDAVANNNYDMKIEGRPSTLMTTVRGCPFDCIFCGNYDRKVKRRDEDNVKQELDEIANKHKLQGVYFTDDSFTLNREHASMVMKNAKEQGLVYRIATRASLLNEDIIKEMKDTGCVYVGLGIESGNDEVLKNCNKHMTTAQNEKAVELLGKHGISTKGFFIIGLPGETEKTAQETIEFALKLKKKGLTDADFYPLVPYPGTKIWKDPSKYGLDIISDRADRYIQAGNADINPVINVRGGFNHSKIKTYLDKAKTLWNKS